MNVIYDDGGRAAAGYKGSAKDCAVRSIAIATQRQYQEVYDALFALNRRYNGCSGTDSSPRNGKTRTRDIREYMASIGWAWTPTMGIGTGCKVHLVGGELPTGRLVVRLSSHLAAVIDGVIRDTHDPQRANIVCEDGVQRIAHRCVYGYWRKEGDCVRPPIPGTRPSRSGVEW